MPGELMRAEMAEQPVVLARLLERRAEAAAAVRAALPGAFAGVVVVARGSSDHAAIYGRYLLELATRRPVALAAPSLDTRYGASTDASGWLVVGVSQSGETPEIVEVTARLRAAGGRTVALTNAPGSPLAAAADAVLELAAGEERAVPATKTFTAQVAVFAVLAETLGPVPWAPVDVAAVPDPVAAALDDAAPARALAAAWAGADDLLVTARGFLFAAALETALKVRESALIGAQAYSTADLLHGPVAAVEPDAPVLVLRWPGPVARDVDDALAALRQRRADVRVAAPAPEVALPLPAGLPEPLAVFPAAVLGQQIALELALRRGVDPDTPRGLSKVTATS